MKNPGKEADTGSILRGIRQEAADAGLNLLLVLSRRRVEAAFVPPSHKPSARNVSPRSSPKAIHPGYRRLVLLGSAGAKFWQGFRNHRRAGERLENNPLDGYTVRVVSSLLARLAREDSTAQAAYPFRHARQIVPFQAILAGSSLMRPLPFGVSVHPRFGPWFSWRAALLTRLELSLSALPRKSPCDGCPAPCIEACPPGAAGLEGFRWETCTRFRLESHTCATSCRSRLSCPVGSEYRYPQEAMSYHYRASLREIRKMAETAG